VHRVRQASPALKGQAAPPGRLAQRARLAGPGRLERMGQQAPQVRGVRRALLA